MKKIIFILFIVAGSFHFTYGQSRGIPGSKEKFCMNLLKQYDTESYLLVNRYTNTYKGIFKSYLIGKDIYNLLYSLPIAVHEMAHLYNNTSKMAFPGLPMNIPGLSGMPISTKTVTRTIPSRLKAEKYNEILDKTIARGDKNFFKLVYKKDSRSGKFNLTNAYRGNISKLVRILDKAGYYGKQEQTEKINIPKGEMKYYIVNSTEHKVPITDIFLTREMAKTIPVSLRRYRYNRYSIYIDSKNTALTSQGKGIYGLMDEWCAFYNGSRAAVKMFPYYKNKLPQNVNTWRWYFKTTNWHYWSYYDMKYYIYKYLQFARNHYPARYRALKSNDKLIRTFNDLDTKWQSLISELNEIKNETYSKLRSEGYTITVGDKITTIKKGKKRLGLLNFNFVIKKLKNELEKDIYEDLL